MNKKITSIILVSSILLTSCSQKQESKIENSNEETSYKIVNSEISKDQWYIWYIEPVEQSNVWAKIWWRLTNVYVNKWDRVKEWQLIATLDWSEIYTTLNNAWNTLDSTKLVFNNTNSLFDAQIEAANKKIEQAKKAVELADENTKWRETWTLDTQNIITEQLNVASKQIEQAELALETANNQYNNTKQLIEQKENDIYWNGKNTLSKSQILAKNLLDYVDIIFWITEFNRDKNDSYEIYLSAKNSNYKQQVESNFIKSNNYYEKRKNDIYNFDLNTQSWKESLYKKLKDTEDFFVDLSKMAQNTYSALDNSIPTTYFPETIINSHKQKIVEFQNNIESMLLSVNWNYITWIRWSIQSIDNVKNEKNLQLSMLQKQIDLATKQVEVARSNYSQYQAVSNWKVNEITTQTDIAKKQAEIAREQYKEAQASLETLRKQKETQLSQIWAQLSQIEWNKDLAWVNASNTQIVAPFDWVIVEKLWSVWQVVWAWLPIFVIAKDADLKIKVLVTESEVSKFKIWDSAKIEISSNSKIIDWKIKVIQPIADVMSKKIPVEIWINNKDKQLTIWMYTNVYFSWEKISGKTVPFKYIEYSYWSPILNIKKSDWKIEKIKIETKWCSQNNCLIEWQVNIWDEVILP